jgi:hypothetical protein
MSVMEIPNLEQLSDLQRLELAEELFASVRNPQALPVALGSSTRITTALV